MSIKLSSTGSKLSSGFSFIVFEEGHYDMTVKAASIKTNANTGHEYFQLTLVDAEGQALCARNYMHTDGGVKELQRVLGQVMKIAGIQDCELDGAFMAALKGTQVKASVVVTDDGKFNNVLGYGYPSDSLAF